MPTKIILNSDIVETGTVEKIKVYNKGYTIIDLNGHNLEISMGQISASNAAVVEFMDNTWTKPFMDNGVLKGIRPNNLALDCGLIAIQGSKIILNGINVTYYNSTQNIQSGNGAILYSNQTSNITVENAYIKGTNKIYYSDNGDSTTKFIFNGGVFTPATIQEKYIGEGHNLSIINDIAIVN